MGRRTDKDMGRSQILAGPTSTGSVSLCDTARSSGAEENQSGEESKNGIVAVGCDQNFSIDSYSSSRTRLFRNRELRRESPGEDATAGQGRLCGCRRGKKRKSPFSEWHRRRSPEKWRRPWSAPVSSCSSARMARVPAAEIAMEESWLSRRSNGSQRRTVVVPRGDPGSDEAFPVEFYDYAGTSPSGIWLRSVVNSRAESPRARVPHGCAT